MRGQQKLKLDASALASSSPVLDMRKKSPYKWGDALVAQLDRAIAS